MNVLEVPSTTGVRVTSWANVKNNKWTLTPVRDLIADFEAKHPDEMVLAAINADGFDINGKKPLRYQTSGLHLSNGENYKTTTGTRKSLAFVNNGSVDSIIVKDSIKRETYIQMDIFNSLGKIERTFNVQQINKTPEVGETALYYGLYDKEHNYMPIETPEGATSYVVGEAELALPNNTSDFYGKGIISSVGSTTLQKGQFAIVTTEDSVVNTLTTGSNIRVQRKFAGALANIKDATGGGANILRNGEFSKEMDIARHPRTVIGQKADGTIIMAVGDGRQPSKGMYGFDGAELSAMMRHYGAVEAYNLDGGGSSTMVIRQGNEFVVTNSPSDGWERSDSNCILVVANKPDLEIEVAETTQRSITLNVEKIDINTHDMDKLFVSINNNDVEVVDGKAEVTGLQVGTTYDYSVYYRDSRGQRIPLQDSAQVSTLNHMPLFKGVKVTEDTTSFTITIDFTDRSNVSNYKIAPVKVNEKDYNFVNGSVNVLKADVGEEILTLSVLLEYDKTVTEKYSRWLNNPHIPFAITLETMIESLDNKINKIYK